MVNSFAERLQMMSIQIVPFIMAVVFHEYAHGFIAARWGDKTAQERGRLTLNPLPHMDLFGTVIFPIAGMLSGFSMLFGWAKPVPIDPRRFKKYRPALFWISLAGPGMNFLLATISAAAYCAIELWMPHDFYLFEPLVGMAFVSVSLNYALGIFNLIPLPPLDGSKVIQAFLPIEAARKYETIARYSLIILLALMMTNALSVLVYPIRLLSGLTLYGMSRLFGLPPESLF